MTSKPTRTGVFVFDGCPITDLVVIVDGEVFVADAELLGVRAVHPRTDSEMRDAIGKARGTYARAHDERDLPVVMW